MTDQSSDSLSRVEWAVLNELALQSGLTQAEIASFLRINQSHLDQCTKEQLSDLDQNHLHQLVGVLHHGLAVFDQHITAFTKWLQTPHPELACVQTGFPPLEPVTPPPSLEAIGASKPFDLMATSIQHDPPSAPPRSYPTPLSLLDTSSGIKLVDDIFVRIEAGVYA